MSKIAIITDSNSGILPEDARELGITVMPMPFYINDEMFLENITMSQDEFYERLAGGGEVKTSAPAVQDFVDLWDGLLKDYDQIVHIPMSSGLSGTCATAAMLAQDYEGKVFVVDNQRISVTQRQSAVDARMLADAGADAREIYDKLMANKMESSIYIMVNTLYYLKKGGRITPAAAALGNLLKIKPVLQIQGEKLDSFAKARTVKQAKSIMINQIKEDCLKRYGSDEQATGIHISMAYTHNLPDAEIFKKEVQAAFPRDWDDIVLDQLSISIGCHIGPGALAVTATKPITID